MKRLAIPLVLGAILALAACNPQQAAQQSDATYVNFDAMCSMDSPPGEGRRYAIDLDRRVWCEAGPRCAATRRPVVSADRNAIVLISGAEGGLVLDRASGRLEGTQNGQQVSGICSRTVHTPIG